MKRILKALGLALLAVLLFVTPILAVSQVSTTVVTDICSVCPVGVSWAVGQVPGAVPTGNFTYGALDADWEMGKPTYIWLGLNCTEEAGLSGLQIAFETGFDMLGIVRTEPPQGWPSVVSYHAGFESGTYLYGPSGGFHMSYGMAYAEFKVTPQTLGCYNLEVYVVQGVPAQEI